MADLTCKLLIIGAGPGGYVCAIRAAQQGVETIIVEAEKQGGTCLNVGCIPSKALIHAADEFYNVRQLGGDNQFGINTAAATIDLSKTMDWKDAIVKRLNIGVGGLLKKAGATALEGSARFLDGKTVEVESGSNRQVVRAEYVVIATGSVPVELPSLPFGEKVISSTGALSLPIVPASLAVVGGGYIGLEIGTAFAKLGTRVMVVESADRILPQYDKQLTAPVQKHLAQLGIEVIIGARATGMGDTGLAITAADGNPLEITAEKILVAVGRRARTEGWGLEELQLTMDDTFIQINEKCQTSMRGVYAIGDVTGEPMLAHRAMAQGEMVARIIAGENPVWDKVCIPSVCFTDPQIVTVGLAPSDAIARDIEIHVSQYPFTANGRAMTLGREDGFIRMVARKDDGVVVGIQAVGAGVSELSAAFALALEMGACAEDIAATIHSHPTLSEGIQEAAMLLTGCAVHV